MTNYHDPLSFTPQRKPLLDRLGSGRQIAELVLPIVDWMREQTVKEITIKLDGITSHLWSALAIATYALDTQPAKP